MRYYLEVKIAPTGRVRIIKSPPPFIRGIDIGDIDAAINKLKEERDKFNKSIDEVIDRLIEIKKWNEENK